MSTTNKPHKPETVLAFGIAAVQRDTGLTKEVLRVWERRYGFPSPSRDWKGERVYPLEQVEKLRLLKRLMDTGVRPGKIIGKGLEELLALVSQQTPSTTVPARVQEEIRTVLLAIQALDAISLRADLRRLLIGMGLSRFVTEIVPVLNRIVGEGSQRGEVPVYAEHLYTQQIQDALRRAIDDLQIARMGPRILLTTFPCEEHVLGLLMAEAILALGRAECIVLGPKTPVDQIADAANEHNIDVVMLSFSTAFATNLALKGLRDLRKLLSDNISVWAGGDGLKGIRTRIEGVAMPMTLASLAAELEKTYKEVQVL